MDRFVALLRGVNVGGPGTRLVMGEMCAALEAAGFRDVTTYIQSGNAVFRAGGRPDDVAAKVSAAVMLASGRHPDCVALTLGAFEAALAANPFPEAEAAPKTLHLVFHAEVPPAEYVDRLRVAAGPGERVEREGRVVYLSTPGGIGRSKLGAKIAAPPRGVVVTSRNLATCRALADLARAMPQA